MTIRVDKDFYRDVKVHIANKGITLKDYLVGLMKEDLNKK